MRKLEYRSVEHVKPGIIQNYVAQAISKLDYFIANWKEISKKG